MRRCAGKPDKSRQHLRCLACVYMIVVCKEAATNLRPCLVNQNAKKWENGRGAGPVLQVVHCK